MKGITARLEKLINRKVKYIDSLTDEEWDNLTAKDQKDIEKYTLDSPDNILPNLLADELINFGFIIPKEIYVFSIEKEKLL